MCAWRYLKSRKIYNVHNQCHVYFRKLHVVWIWFEFFYVVRIWMWSAELSFDCVLAVQSCVPKFELNFAELFGVCGSVGQMVQFSFLLRNRIHFHVSHLLHKFCCNKHKYVLGTNIITPLYLWKSCHDRITEHLINNQTSNIVNKTVVAMHEFQHCRGKWQNLLKWIVSTKPFQKYRRVKFPACDNRRCAEDTFLNLKSENQNANFKIRHQNCKLILNSYLYVTPKMVWKINLILQMWRMLMPDSTRRDSLKPLLPHLHSLLLD